MTLVRVALRIVMVRSRVRVRARRINVQGSDILIVRFNPFTDRAIASISLSCALLRSIQA